MSPPPPCPSCAPPHVPSSLEEEEGLRRSVLRASASVWRVAWMARWGWDWAWAVVLVVWSWGMWAMKVCVCV